MKNFIKKLKNFPKFYLFFIKIKYFFFVYMNINNYKIILNNKKIYKYKIY